jgi:hypothetical protein
MLSFEGLCAQEGHLDKENVGISKLITLLYPDGILAMPEPLKRSAQRQKTE